MTNTDVTWSTVVWTQRRDNSNWLQYYKSTNHLWQSYSVYYCIWCADIVLVYFRRCIVKFCLMFFTTSYILYENWLLFYFLTNHCTCMYTDSLYSHYFSSEKFHVTGILTYFSALTVRNLKWIVFYTAYMWYELWTG